MAGFVLSAVLGCSRNFLRYRCNLEKLGMTADDDERKLDGVSIFSDEACEPVVEVSIAREVDLVGVTYPFSFAS